MSRLRSNRLRRALVETTIDEETANVLAAEIAASPQAMIVALRREEASNQRASRLHQWRENRLACAYSRHIIVDKEMGRGEWKCLHPAKGWCRGREGVLPTAKSIGQKEWLAVRLSSDVADAVLLRDTGERPPA